MRLFGEGLVALRFSETIFQILGLWAGLLAASRVAQNWALLAGVGLMLTLWMFPSHKLFDITFLLCGIWIAVRLIEQPSPDSNFHGRFFCRPVRLFRQKSRTLQFSRTSVSVALPSFQTGPICCRCRISECGLQVSWLALCRRSRCSSLCLGFLQVTSSPFSRFFAMEPISHYLSRGPGGFRQIPTAGTTQFLLGIFLIAIPLGYLAAITRFPLHAIANDQGSCAFDRVRFRWFILFAPCLFTR